MLLARRLEEVQYKLLGPTVAHLRFEFYLWICLVLITYSSLLGLYKESFGLIGDYTLIAMIALISGRHLVFRILCTWDPSTHASPGIRGWISHISQSHILAGQSFDRPLQNYHASLTSTNLGASHSNAPIFGPSAADRMVQITGGTTSIDARTLASWRDVLPTSLLYIVSMLQVNVWNPIGNWNIAHIRNESFRESAASKHHRQFRNQEVSKVEALWQSTKGARYYMTHLMLSKIPTLSFFVTIGAFLGCISFLNKVRTGTSLWTLLVGPDLHDSQAILSVHTQQNLERQLPEIAVKSAGRYQFFPIPTFNEVFELMLAMCTLFCLLVFSRVMPPFPDLVACGNVIRDVRLEARAAATAATTSAGKRTSGRLRRYISHIVDGFFWCFYVPTGLTSDTAGWTERMRSITAENRIRLCMNVIFVRLIENIFLVGVLPRTLYACRASGHCPSGLPFWEVSRILFVGGFSEPRRSDGSGFSDFMEQDALSSIFTYLSVVLLSIVLLSVQTLLLDRSYLSILGYISGEWELIDAWKGSHDANQSANEAKTLMTGSIGDPLPWDQRRKYKKGDVVLYGNSVYQATSNSPEGRPADRSLCRMNEVLRSEFGHPSSSKLVLQTARLQFWIAFTHLAILIVLVLLDSQSKYGMIGIVVAQLVACHAVLSGARPFGRSSKADHSAANLGELEQLRHEISIGQD
jgi:hypothetical protein